MHLLLTTHLEGGIFLTMNNAQDKLNGGNKMTKREIKVSFKAESKKVLGSLVADVCMYFGGELVAFFEAPSEKKAKDACKRFAAQEILICGMCKQVNITYIF